MTITPTIISPWAMDLLMVAGDFSGSITDTSVELPTWDEFVRIVLLRDYNTRIVMIGTMLLGLASGIVGTFILLRKRSLMGDAISHATLPGIGIAYVIMVYFGGSGKFLPGLLAGALVSGILGMGLILLIRSVTRIKEDAALGIILSVFFGWGVAILGIIQKMSTGHAAGLESFIYGKTASMLAADAWLITSIAAIVVLCCALLYKEFTQICFDHNYASARGVPVLLLDGVMMLLVVVVTVIGLQAVGLILVIALLIIPAAAARFWSDNLLKIVALSAGIGAASGLIGAGLSAMVPRLPAGAIIVLVAAACFLFSMICGSARGMLIRITQQLRLKRKVGHQNLLRALYEGSEKLRKLNESAGNGGSVGDRHPVNLDVLLAARSWTEKRLRRLLRRALREDLLRSPSENNYRLTESGFAAARRIVRNHRLWEIYLITHADIAPGKVDRDADQIEHVLGQVMVDKLERKLVSQYPQLAMPTSPHEL